MRLHSLALRNFRQHADTQVSFTDGLTGIIGANGAGKTTLLEAIAWALYGNSAARGTRDSIRHSRAADNAPVRVTLEFELGGHRYRVDRTLRTADVYLDNSAEPIARTIRGVNELLQRRLGMSRSEFFNTYFTGQKELDVMAALGPVDRARFLARVLGYDRLGAAQEMLREQRRSIIAELNGLRSGMPNAEHIAAREVAADQALSAARDRVELANASLQSSRAALEALTPQWESAAQRREHALALDADLRVLEQERQSGERERARLREELEAVASAQRELAPLLVVVQSRDELQQRVDTLDALAAAAGEGRALEERARTLAEERTRMRERLEKLESAPTLEQDQRDVLMRARAAVAHAEQLHDEARTTWARDRQEAATRLEALRTQQTELEQQRNSLEGLGPESPCPTCARPLGPSFREVLALITEQLETVTADAKYYQRRVRQLEQTPEPLQALEAQRTTLQQEVATAERRYARIQAALQEREQLTPQLAGIDHRIAETDGKRAALPTGYDEVMHRELRADLRRVSAVAAQVASLQATANRDAPLQDALVQATNAASALAERVQHVQAARSALDFSAERYEALRAQYTTAVEQERAAELAASEARGAVERARQERESARSAREQLERLQLRATALETERSLHDELDEEFGALREELNDRLRPELSELASTFLESLTDGRYAALELDEQYGVQVLEDGLPKTVLSGGEEDLCNLVLRLAISQMIAERAGQPFSLLILDEVFGSLDESRRENVLALLRRLHDRFEQVIVITHIEDVREGLDRVLSVTYDSEHGTSRVQASLGGAAGADAAAFAAELV